jgi:NADH-ubiquinone oxidoreductase chain 2
MLSLIVGTVVGLAQIKLKRLLAYSTISHVGFILLALSIKSSHSIDSLLFYIIQYTITNLGIFLIIINFMDVKFIKDMKGMLYENTFVSFSLIISFFSLAGIPPLLGFFAKQYTLLAAVQSNYYLISIIAIITSVISASYYLKLINMIMTEKNTSYDNITTLTNITNIFKKSNNNSNNNISNNNKRNINSITIVEKKLLFLFNDNNFENKVLPSLVSASSPICNIIAIITLAMTLFIFKPSIMLSSTGVLSLQL